MLLVRHAKAKVVLPIHDKPSLVHFKQSKIVVYVQERERFPKKNVQRVKVLVPRTKFESKLKKVLRSNAEKEEESS